MPKRILSIDGGGMKGIVSAFFLQSLEEKLAEYSHREDARIADYFDLIAGTSTGSILTTLYLYPNERGESKFSAKEVTQAYIDYGKYIFRRQMLFPIWGAKYTSKYLEEMLDEYFHDDRLSNLRKPCLITSYDMARRNAVFMNSVTGRNDERRNYLLKEAVLASCAAPTYFSPTCIHNKKMVCYGCLIDGGVIANNPSFCALVEALKLPNCNDICDTISVSVGNIKNTKYYSHHKAKFWGLFQWARPMLDILLDGNEQTVDYQMRRLYKSLNCPSNYYRFLMTTEGEVPKMDQCSDEAIKKFLDYGEKFVRKERLRIEELAKKLVDSEQQRERSFVRVSYRT